MVGDHRVGREALVDGEDGGAACRHVLVLQGAHQARPGRLRPQRLPARQHALGDRRTVERRRLFAGRQAVGLFHHHRHRQDAGPAHREVHRLGVGRCLDRSLEGLLELSFEHLRGGHLGGRVLGSRGGGREQQRADRHAERGTAGDGPGREHHGTSWRENMQQSSKRSFHRSDRTGPPPRDE
ncbi:MAG TPA: hypothetical protein VKU40_17795, partial [Thermoanaerobaculia bacterium]|nr:hypothetical protein [Thermoanaerobaculia bacterium]